MLQRSRKTICSQSNTLVRKCNLETRGNAAMNSLSTIRISTPNALTSSFQSNRPSSHFFCTTSYVYDNSPAHSGTSNVPMIPKLSSSRGYSNATSSIMFHKPLITPSYNSMSGSVAWKSTSPSAIQETQGDDDIAQHNMNSGAAGAGNQRRRRKNLPPISSSVPPLSDDKQEEQIKTFRKHKGNRRHQQKQKHGRQNSIQQNNQQVASPTTGGGKNVEKLREAFMQSLTLDRERRTTNTKNNRTNNGRTNSSFGKEPKQYSESPSRTNQSKQQGPQEGKGIDRLHTAFREALEIDQQRRRDQRSQQQNVEDMINNRNNDIGNGNGTTESRLADLLRRSKDQSREGGGGRGSVHDNNIGGAKAFRERRKSAERMQRQEQQRNQGQHNRRGNPRFQNQSQRGGSYDQIGVDTSVNVRQLQQEMMKGMNNVATPTAPIDEDVDKTVVLPSRQSISIVELASLLRVQKEKIIHIMKSQGLDDSFASFYRSSVSSDPSSGSSTSFSSQVLSEYAMEVDIAELVALELGFDPQRTRRSGGKLGAAERRILRNQHSSSLLFSGDEEEVDERTEAAIQEELDYQALSPRPPVVCIMGHVDHGKTTLMDSLRRKAAEAALKGGKGAKSGGKGSKGKKRKKNKAKKGTKEGDSLIKEMAGSEAGGITQVISAFQVQLPSASLLEDDDGDSDSISAVTFLDTPGHAAFKAMRQSGSNGADVIVLVVAADDGVSPQTIEIIDMYKSIARSMPGSISLVVAMTKTDKPGIDVDESTMMIEGQLMEHDIYTERMTTSDCEFGGVQFVPVSGMTGDGLDDLIEGLVLQSEIMDLRADTEARAEGLVIDAKMEKGLGVVVDCIVRWGKLEKGDYVVSGTNGGRIRILNDVNNKVLNKAGPSHPVRIIGLKTLPKAGDPIICVSSEEVGKEIIEKREHILATMDDDDESRVGSLLESAQSFRADATEMTESDIQITGVASKHGSMSQKVYDKYGLSSNTTNTSTDPSSSSSSSNHDGADDEIRIPVILKADADGTLAALRDSVLAISSESKLNLCIDPVGLSIGQVTASDVRMASESGATIFCFNLKGSKDKTAMSLALSEGVKIQGHDVIYHLLDDAKDVFSTYCPPVETEVIHGFGVVQAVFDVNNKKDAERVAGMKVQDGTLYLDRSPAVSTGGSGGGKKGGGTKKGLQCEYRVKRNGKIISPKALRAKTIRRVKEEVSDVRMGDECGLSLNSYTDLEEGDIIECFSLEMKNIFV